MIRWRALAFFCLALLGAGGLVMRAQGAASITYDVTFSDYKSGPALDWLAQKGFTPKRDANNANRVVYTPGNNVLTLATKRQAAGLLLSESDVFNYSRVRIDWGVDVFPPGASYVKGVRAESIMVFVFFGKEKQSSGSFLIPDSPYFIGLYLCDTDPIGQGFTGRYFQAGGRYVCADHAHPGQPVVTDYAIAEEFTKQFGKSVVPPISGLGLSIDTEAAKGNGVGKSFIGGIEFLK